MAITELDKQMFRAVQIDLEFNYDAPIRKVWRALVIETTKWWPKDFYTSNKTKSFVIRPKLGGHMFENLGNGAGLVWMTVLGIEAPKYLYLAGHISPPFGGPAVSLLTINLAEKGKTGTTIKLQDNCFGQISEKMAQSLDDGWKILFEGNLKPYVEKKKRD